MPMAVLAGFGLAIVAVLVTSWLAYDSLQDRTRATTGITRTYKVIVRMEDLVSSVKDAETGQRGFLLVGSENYLEPYNAARTALPGDVQALYGMLRNSPEQLRRLDGLAQAIDAKLVEFTETIALRRRGDTEAANAIVRSGRGKEAMDRLRALVGEMEQHERGVLAQQQIEWQRSATYSTVVTLVGSAVLLTMVALAAWASSRNHRQRETETWTRSGQALLAERLQGDQRLDALAEKMLAFLADYLGAQVATLYIDEGGGRFRRVGGYALPAGAPDVLRAGDGLLGQVARDRRALHVREVPAGYLSVSSSLGRAGAQELLIAPARTDGVVQALLELGFFRRLGTADLDFMERVSESIGVAVRASKDRSRLEELLGETQAQSEELQAQQEELRVSNEELEEQGRALKESQASLQAQHAELEASTAQLEEHARLLEDQKDVLSSSEAALAGKAADLERASQYKSEFLANMSHELRTPLNSTLILAKLLADNKEGNLSGEQVKFARTIHSAGNDLLVLINDVLDLSKIEAGAAEVVAERVGMTRLLDGLMRTFKPVAEEKGLAFSVATLPGAPERIETDGQRLVQILRNLLSNAIKFTESGEVTLQIAAGDGETVDFVVRDTGIGIDADKHALVFEAFRQAEGGTHRKYGGTGLGLSISRDLAGLLGGRVALHSEAGKGSVFTLTLPLVYRAPPPAPEAAPAPTQARAGLATAASALAPPRPQRSPWSAPPTATPPAPTDDRDQHSPGARTILVIEDDVRFAAILQDLAHEKGFACIVTHSANDGVAAALRYRPSAILLDMNLPDYSGLGVLDQLKRNPQTRHIPVHVASVADYSQEALERGAIGYALKPVKREDLVSALELLEAKFSRGLRRLLIVEDDEAQRLGMCQLLGSEGVEITVAGDAAEALEHLKKGTFDCMVMDLNLPDLSGYALLEKMADEDDVAFPPVIVYTGKAMTGDEEQALRRYSRSIIVKGAHSPERLLDEVTLFLHQVETELPASSQRLLQAARNREASFEGRRILIVEDDVRNVFALTSVLEPKGVIVEIARNGREALDKLSQHNAGSAKGSIDLVLMDIMMPEMDGMTAMREIRKRPEWKRLPIIALTAKAMRDDHEKCLDAGANDYIAKPLDVEKLLSLVRVWLPA